MSRSASRWESRKEDVSLLYCTVDPISRGASVLGLKFKCWGRQISPDQVRLSLRRHIASFDCGTVFGILLSDEKGRVPNGVIVELSTAEHQVLSKGLPTAARLRCPQGPTALARSWETQSHILSVSEECRSHFDVTGQEDHSAQVLRAHRGGTRVLRLVWLPVAGGTGALAEAAMAPGLR